MSHDRTRPPPHYEVTQVNAEGLGRGRSYVEQHARAKMWDIPGIDCSTEAGAVDACWRHRDLVRAELLRELAAEFRMNVPDSDEEFASELARMAHIGYDSAIEGIHDELTRRADALEADSSRTTSE